MCYPAGLIVDSNARLYIAVEGNSCVRMIDLKTGIISLVASTGYGTFVSGVSPLSSSMFRFPESVSLNTVGDLYIADYDQKIVTVISHSTGAIYLYAGTVGVSGQGGDGGAASLATLRTPYGKYMYDLYVCR
jgi:hypothetical protein